MYRCTPRGAPWHGCRRLKRMKGPWRRSALHTNICPRGSMPQGTHTLRSTAAPLCSPPPAQPPPPHSAPPGPRPGPAWAPMWALRRTRSTRRRSGKRTRSTRRRSSTRSTVGEMRARARPRATTVGSAVGGWGGCRRVVLACMPILPPLHLAAAISFHGTRRTAPAPCKPLPRLMHPTGSDAEQTLRRERAAVNKLRDVLYLYPAVKKDLREVCVHTARVKGGWGRAGRASWEGSFPAGGDL